jgi:hypothetical protein
MDSVLKFCLVHPKEINIVIALTNVPNTTESRWRSWVQFLFDSGISKAARVAYVDIRIGYSNLLKLYNFLTVNPIFFRKHVIVYHH